MLAAIILGKQWRNESAETKAEFVSMAEDLKKQHLRDYPDYQYQPRKSSEKKRRMTRRKTELLNESTKQPITESTSKDADKIGTSTAIEDIVPTFEDVVNSSPYLTDDLFNESNGLTNDEIFNPFGLHFEETGSGNAMFNLGNDSINDEEFLAMIENHNDDLVNFTSVVDSTSAPVLFHETTEDAKNDENFYVNAVDLDRLSLPTFPAEELETNEESISTVFTQLGAQLHQAAFDQAGNQIQQAESERQKTV